MDRNRVLLVSASLLIAQSVWADCDVSGPRSAEVDATGVRKVVVGARAGDLRVVGIADASVVRANGDACSDNRRTLESIQLEARRNGDTVHVTVIIPRKDAYTSNSKLDLKVEMPASAVLELTDTSGDLEVSRIAGARIEDSSGDQHVHHIEGDVTIEDSSGDIDVEDVRGAVAISDSSGEITVRDVAGEVTIPYDSSGDMSFRRVSGDVHVISDSSGDISISNVNRNVRIDKDSSGGIRVGDVAGDLTISNDGPGDIVHRNVLGRISLPKD